MRKTLLGLVLGLGLFSCTENSRIKNFGGEGDLDLPSGNKLVNVTWKEDQIWYLTRPMTSKDEAVTYTFKEESSFGVLQGTFFIHEHK